MSILMMCQVITLTYAMTLWNHIHVCYTLPTYSLVNWNLTRRREVTIIALKKICWLCFPVEFFFPLCYLRSIVKERIFCRNLTKTRCILIQHFQQHYPLFNLKINCKKKEKKNWWKEGKFIVHVYTKEGLISWSFHVSLCLGTGGLPPFFSKPWNGEWP